MKNNSFEQLVQIVQGEVVSGSTDNFQIESIATSLSYLKDNGVFFHYRSGRRLHLNDFSKLKRCAIVTSRLENVEMELQYRSGITIIKTNNSKETYWRFVEAYRSQYQIPIICITGTCGKTTTKDMLVHILNQEKKKVVATKGSYNSLELCIKYLTEIDEETEVAVLETGVAYPGDLNFSLRHFKPTIGMITNIGKDHLQGCKTFDRYKNEKFQMLGHIKNEGLALLNCDDLTIHEQDQVGKEKIIWFGEDCNAADYQIQAIQVLADKTQYKVIALGKEYNVTLKTIGAHNAYNATGAIALANMIGIPIERSVQHLSSFSPLLERLQAYPNGYQSATILNDTWSHNLVSLSSALQALKQIGKNKKKIAIIGSLPRVHNEVKEEYRNIAELIFEANVDLFIAIGPDQTHAITRAYELGMPQSSVVHAKNEEEAYHFARSYMDKDSIVLVKIEDAKRHLIRKMLYRNK